MSDYPAHLNRSSALRSVWATTNGGTETRNTHTAETVTSKFIPTKTHPPPHGPDAALATMFF